MRDGYDPVFLGANYRIDLPEPGLVLAADVLQPPLLPEGTTVVPYIHFSLIMSRKTKQALYSAANVDNTQYQTVSGSRGRVWFRDNRIGLENQIPNYPYEGTRWDRGHLTRRTAVTWGDEATALNASNDSCSYANACMQHKNFNEDEWREVERLVSRNKNEKYCVVTGPIFTQADRYFTREFNDEPVRIPSGFWKIISYVDKQDRELKTQAFIFFQSLDTIRNSADDDRIDLFDMQVTTTEVAQWTGLEFAKVLYDSNPLKFYSGPERISLKERRNLLNQDDTIEIDAGIPGEKSVGTLRRSLPLGDLYELIREVSWV